MAAIALLYLGGLCMAVLFTAFAAVESAPRRPNMTDHTRLLAFAVADSVRATTPDFTPPPSRRWRAALRVVGVLVVLAPFAALFLSRCM